MKENLSIGDHVPWHLGTKQLWLPAGMLLSTPAIERGETGSTMTFSEARASQGMSLNLPFQESQKGRALKIIFPLCESSQNKMIQCLVYLNMYRVS